MKNKSKYYIAAVLFLVMAVFGSHVYAENLGNIEMDIKGDFVLYPAKNELLMDPGEEREAIVHIVNRTERPLAFNVQKQNMIAAPGLDEPVSFTEDSEESPYSLSEYLEIEEESFVLASQEQKELGVNISLPDNPNLAGLYGALLISTSTDNDSEGDFVEGESRAASLFFVRVDGDIQEEGQLLDFYSDKSFYSESTVAFNLLTENTGNVHLNSYGKINIRNTFGREVASLGLDPWFTMPEGERLREVVWSKDEFMFGRYTAKARINRGYGEEGGIIDEQEITFWVLPWQGLVATALVFMLLVILALMRWRKSGK